MADQKVITDDDKSALVQVLTLYFMVINILSCFVRSGTKFYIIKTLKADDILTIIGTFFSVGQSVATYEACEHGLGQHFDVLSAADKESYFKSKYAADILFILALASCKLASAHNLRVLAWDKLLPLVLVCEIVAGVWGLVALIVILFQCHLPSPWVTVPATQCISQFGFYTYFSVTNIVTDLAMVILMVWSVSKLQTSWFNRVLVMVFFGGRILMIPAIAVQIAYSIQYFASEDDPTFVLWKATIAILVVQCLSVFTVCLPNFKFLLDILQSGQIRIDDLRRQGRTTTESNGYKHYGSSNNDSSARRKTVQRSNDRSVAASEVHEMVALSKVTGGKKGPSEPGRAWDGQSQTSQTILVEQTWQIDSQSVHA